MKQWPRSIPWSITGLGDVGEDSPGWFSKEDPRRRPPPQENKE